MMHPIESFADDRVRRYFDVFPQLSPEQVTVSKISKAGTINAWHRHKRQTDWFVVIEGRLEAFILTKEKHLTRHMLDGASPQCLEIQPGLYHGWKSLQDNTILVYCLSHKHDEKDEERVPYETM
ncbi:MAG: dTDP-4-dehydrorhamnose 3,5-epimerase family protein, partial [Candidatus Omnitrophica bacterium]|nr:dTDP-4-dehydrorhamnose 3,5-epimerase family protein [Candidatus Omnitrophota bacterium]